MRYQALSAGEMDGRAAVGRHFVHITTIFDAAIIPKKRPAVSCRSLQCGAERESNSHRLTPTTPSKWRVYHFTTSAFGLGLQRYIDFI